MISKNFSKKLIQWFESNKRSLPWRQTRDPYKIWISEIMLQQTTVQAVIPYYKRWVKEFPDVQSLRKASLQNVLRAWQGLGYYSRARNIKKAADLIVEKFLGKIPEDPQELRTLPGFGPYTVGAVLSIAYDKRVPIVDANVRRVMMRLLAKKGEANTTQDKLIYAQLEKLLPKTNMSSFNQGLMELGALVCRSKEPLCGQCPVRKFCKACKEGIQEIIPQPKVMVIKDVGVAVAVIEKNKKYYIQRRPPKGLLADLWEFPGGKIEKGETSAQALAREVKEELGVKLGSKKLLTTVKHCYTHFRATLHVYRCSTKEKLLSDARHKWVGLKDVVQYPMPSGSVKIVEKLKNL